MHENVHLWECRICHESCFTAGHLKWHSFSKHTVGLFRCAEPNCRFMATEIAAVVEHFDSNLHIYDISNNATKMEKEREEKERCVTFGVNCPYAPECVLAFMNMVELDAHVLSNHAHVAYRCRHKDCRTQAFPTWWVFLLLFFIFNQFYCTIKMKLVNNWESIYAKDMILVRRHNGIAINVDIAIWNIITNCFGIFTYNILRVHSVVWRPTASLWRRREERLASITSNITSTIWCAAFVAAPSRSRIDWMGMDIERCKKIVMLMKRIVLWVSSTANVNKWNLFSFYLLRWSFEQIACKY